MQSSRSFWRFGLPFLVALLFTLPGAGLALADRPVITTPTPGLPPATPLPTPLPPTPTAMPTPYTYSPAPDPVSGVPIVTPAPGRPLITAPTPTPIGGVQETAPEYTSSGPALAPAPVEVDPAAFPYTVQSGDTLFSLALNFGRDLDTMACTTRPLGADAATLAPGQVITVPALSDLCYTVTPGDTLAGIAARYGLDVSTIIAVSWNGFRQSPYQVQPRQRILLPGVRPAARARPNRVTVSVPDDSWAHSPWPGWPYGDGRFIWPVKGPISQAAHEGHHAIDIAVDPGTPVKAADRGTVILAGWSAIGYGFRVVIDHGNDYLTLYAHLSDIYVQEGEVVARGQVIAASGANGNVTGPHLHFEIRDFGILTDPLTLLPPP